MQSQNYVPGVSGWKMHKDGRLEVCGLIRVVLPEVAQIECPPPFIIADGVMYFSQAEIQRGTITKAEIGSGWKLKMKLHGGHYVVAGIGVGGQCSVATEQPGDDANHKLEAMARSISDSQLCRAIRKRIDLLPKIAPLPEEIRDVIRQELRPGGLLYRSNR